MMARRAALVAGGSSGIGLEIARTLAADGHDVTIVARRREGLERAVAALGGRAHAVQADLSEEDGVGAAAAAHRERFGRLDTLVNSAGYGGPRGGLDEIDVAKIDRILAVDLRATILLTRACVPMLRAAGAEHGKALVVNVASVAARLGVEAIAAYSATKGGVAAFGRALAADLAGDGVQVTTLLPGYVETPMSDWVAVPREEMLRPADLAEAVRLLLRTSPACHIPELQLERRGGAV
jgi:NAD(P)-dependent dehydrogenase (short-subunit alcohol dehydrogenase family)